MFFKTLAVAAAVGSAVAQRPTNTSICDYYTTALLMNNTAANQKTLLTLVVNTAVIGNYTMPNVGIMVPGILAPGQYNGTDVNLAPYFNGGLASSNRGGDSGVSVNFLDDGGAAPLMMNMPANGTTSNQYMLLTHLYEYFGSLLGCTMQGMDGYDAYSGSASMFEVHKFMDLSAAEVGYFITQVAYSAASFGVAQEDLMVVGTALGSLFNYKCLPETTIIPTQGAQLQSICIGDACPTAENATCASYQNVTAPAVANATLAGNTTGSDSSSSTMSGTATGTATGTAAAGTASGSATGTASGSSSSSSSTGTSGAGAVIAPAAVALFGGVVAFFL